MKKILIANRGEIACRIMRTCKKMGLGTIAVFSEADAEALHKHNADDAYAIGPAPAPQSYLNVDAIIDAAKAGGADAVHPGYGFLSENTAFAEAIEAAGIAWVGPSVQSIRNMGDKDEARRIAAAAGVPTLPASAPWDGGDLDALKNEAAEIGYPLLVKAAGGGGGIGMRLVEAPEQLETTVSSTHGQATRSFGTGKIYLEKFIERSRHIEVQVFGLGDGRAAAFFDRDCSVQRRFQKILEEAPAPDLPDSVQRAMRDAAVALTGAENYKGAGTIEFILDADTGAFYFLEMNTRIQVEHGVTEMILGVDLVERQLRLALGETGDDLLHVPAPEGAAIEARIYAEDPAKKFFPKPGPLTVFQVPDESTTLRIDSGVRQGDAITPYYDPMIAKVIVLGSDRASAVARLVDALHDFRIEGIQTNREFLINVLENESYRRGPVCTDFVTKNLDALVTPPPERSATN